MATRPTKKPKKTKVPKSKKPTIKAFDTVSDPPPDPPPSSQNSHN